MPLVKMAEPPSPFEFMLGGLSEKAKAFVGSNSPADDLVDSLEPDGSSRYGVVIVESGEFPVVKLFKSMALLAKYVGTLEGQDVCVVCFYGQFMPVSVGKPRYLMTGTEAVLIPAYDGQPITTVGAHVVTASQEMQVDGFLGPPELASTYASQPSSDD